MYQLSFIAEADFRQHVSETLQTYANRLSSIDLSKFNSNIVDPIKLLFDKHMYQVPYEDIIQLELHRQRDKSNTNAIGYFHQNMFRYIAGCHVPAHGWDVVFQKDNVPYYVEMKNKHNTMNASSSQKTYLQMQNKILHEPNAYCLLVETLAPNSRNEPWRCSVNGERCEHEHILRVSMDQFYHLVTGIPDAFYQLCMQLPQTIAELIAQRAVPTLQADTVLQELHNLHSDTLTALYLLVFQTYEGFDQLNL